VPVPDAQQAQAEQQELVVELLHVAQAQALAQPQDAQQAGPSELVQDEQQVVPVASVQDVQPAVLFEQAPRVQLEPYAPHYVGVA